MSNSRRARVRARTVPDKTPPGQVYGQTWIESTPDSEDYVLWSSGIPIDIMPYSKAELTADESHGQYPYRIGGPFENIKLVHSVPQGIVGTGTYYSPFANQTVFGFGHGRIKYTGGFILPDIDWPGCLENRFFRNTILAFQNDSPFRADEAIQGAQVWNRSKPKIEQGGLAVAIAEIRDVPHQLKTSMEGFVKLHSFFSDPLRSSVKYGAKYIDPSKLSKEGAGHFLNHNFGWVPFVKDVVAFIDNVINSEAKISKLMHNNGTWTHVKRDLEAESTDDIAYDSGPGGCLVYPANTMVNSMTEPPHFQVRKADKTHKYSVGRFRYYQPYLDETDPASLGMLGDLRRQLALHGARLTPANLYKATPWTWLIDWTTGAGNLVDNLNSMVIDGMVAKYLYLCTTRSRTYSFQQWLPWWEKCVGPRSLEWRRSVVTKRRVEANSPFGFDLSWPDLSAKQLAILAALGVSRR
jgi:hypothetical protein